MHPTDPTALSDFTDNSGSYWTRLQAARMRHSFLEFVRQAWHVLESDVAFVEDIASTAIIAHLQAASNGRLHNLLINVPPGTAKSLLCACFWPAWVWTHNPRARWLFASYKESLSIRDSLRCRRLIESPWYKRHFGGRWTLSEDQNEKREFSNTRGGSRVVVPMGAGTGVRCDYIVIDDPHSVDGSESDSERTQAVEWYFGTISSRLDNFETGHKVVIQQRLHEADLSGELLRRKADYTALILPAEFEPDRACVTPIWADSRTVAGEILSPRFTREALDDLKASLGSLRYAGQYQQRPTPAGGGLWRRAWFRFWQPSWQNLPPVRVKTATTGVERKDGVVELVPVPVPGKFDSILLSCDLTFGTKNKTSDYVALLVAGRQGANYFLLHVVREKLDYPQTVAAIRGLVERFKPSRVLVEQSASGFAVLQSLQREIPGLIGVKPGADSKGARFSACAAVIEAGQVILPHPSLFAWVDTVLDEFATVPAARHDDVADALQILLNWGIRNNVGRQWNMITTGIMQ